MLQLSVYVQAYYNMSVRVSVLMQIHEHIERVPLHNTFDVHKHQVTSHRFGIRS